MPLPNRLLIAAFLAAALLTTVACGINDLVGEAEFAGADSSNGTTVDEAATPTVTPLRIVTPTPFVQSNATSQPGMSGTATAPPQTAETYVVQEGDTLYSIALKFGVGLDQLISINSLSDPNDIVVGQELKLPQRS